MDKIWYRDPSKSEVIGCCGGDEKNEWPRRTDKSRTQKKKREENTLKTCEQYYNNISACLNVDELNFSKICQVKHFNI